MSVDIGTLIVREPGFKHERPHINGTGITVHRIAIMHKLGYSPEEIVINYPHLSLAGAHAVLAHYHANQAQIDAELETEEAEYERLEREFLKARQMKFFATVKHRRNELRRSQFIADFNWVRPRPRGQARVARDAREDAGAPTCKPL